MAVRSDPSRLRKDSATFCAFVRRYQASSFGLVMNVFHLNMIRIFFFLKQAFHESTYFHFGVFSFCGAFFKKCINLRITRHWLSCVSSCSDTTCMGSCWTAVSLLGCPLSTTTERLIFASQEIGRHLSPRPLGLLLLLLRHAGRSDENSVWPPPSPLRSPASSTAVANNSEFHNSSRKGTIREKSFLFDNLIVQTNHLVDTGHSSPHKQTKTRPFP